MGKFDVAEKSRIRARNANDKVVMLINADSPIVEIKEAMDAASIAMDNYIETLSEARKAEALMKCLKECIAEPVAIGD